NAVSQPVSGLTTGGATGTSSSAGLLPSSMAFLLTKQRWRSVAGTRHRNSATTKRTSLRVDDFLHQTLELGRIREFVPHRLLDVDEALAVDFGHRNDFCAALDHGGFGVLFLGLPQLHVVRHGVLRGL